MYILFENVCDSNLYIYKVVNISKLKVYTIVLINLLVIHFNVRALFLLGRISIF